MKREVMRTVRDTCEHSYSSPRPESKNEDENVICAVINELDHSSPQPEVQIEDENMADVPVTRPLGQNLVPLEDTKMAGVDLRNEYLEKSEPSSSPKSLVHAEEGLGGSDPPLILEEPKPLGSSNERVCLAGETGASVQSPNLQAFSDLSTRMDDDLDGTPVRKKAKTVAVSCESLIEESQDSLLSEVISIKKGDPSLIARPVSTDQALMIVSNLPTKAESRSHSATHPEQRSPTPSTESKFSSPAIDTDSRSYPANQTRSESSFNSTGPISRTRLPKRNPTLATLSTSIQPTTPMRSTRSTAHDEHGSSPFTDVGTRIVFASSSSAGDSKPFLKFLSKKGVKQVQSVHDCTVLCVGKELKKTSKLILAVLLGKDIITDNWVTDSVKENDLLNFVPYIARDPKREAEWGISLAEAIYRGKQGVRVLQDQTILFTPSAKKELGKNGFDELKEIVKCAGAKGVSSALPRKGPQETPSTIVIATQDSAEVEALQPLGWRAYVKDIISLSILRGKLDLETDEFLLKEEKKVNRKRKR